MKRQRGRNRNNNNRSNNSNPNRSLDSNGPGVKVRGNVSTVYEKYSALARDAQSSGNRVNAENLKQHAEHYLRLMNEMETARLAAQAERDAQRASRNENAIDDEAPDGKAGKPQNKHAKSLDDDLTASKSDEDLGELPEGKPIVRTCLVGRNSTPPEAKGPRKKKNRFSV